jgi:hypothetical protein
MKKIFLITFLYTFLSSCTPDTPDTPVPPTNNSVIGPQPTFQFKGNGTLYVCNAVADSRLGWVGFPRIVKQVNKNPINGSITSNYDIIICNKKDIPTKYSQEGAFLANYPITQNTVAGTFVFGSNISNLTTGTFQIIDMGIDFINLGYHYEFNPNVITLTITNVNNGLASGNFSGVIPGGSSQINNGPQMTITEGIFSNVPILE